MAFASPLAMMAPILPVVPVFVPPAIKLDGSMPFAAALALPNGAVAVAVAVPVIAPIEPDSPAAMPAWNVPLWMPSAFAVAVPALAIVDSAFAVPVTVPIVSVAAVPAVVTANPLMP